VVAHCFFDLKGCKQIVLDSVDSSYSNYNYVLKSCYGDMRLFESVVSRGFPDLRLEIIILDIILN